MRIRALPLLLVACFLLAVASSPAVAGAPQEGRRIVAIGDIRGAYEPLVELLGETGLVDGELAWSGGDAVLVQTGNMVDGGVGVRPVLDLMMRLQVEARAAGGDVVALLGDHEVLNLVGELRDVSPETMATFAAEDQTETMREAFKEYVPPFFETTSAWGRATRPKRDDIRDEWIADQIPGRVEYLRAMGPDGPYGEWLRTFPVIAEVDGLLFMHASVTPQLAGWSVDDINARLADEIGALDSYRRYLFEEKKITSFSDLAETIRGIRLDAGGVDWFAAPREQLNKPPALPTGELGRMKSEERAEPLLRINGWFVLAARGPIWHRGFADSPEGMLAAQLPGLLEAAGARAVVSGLGVAESRAIQARSGGSMFLIDTAMWQPGGRGAALVLEGGQAAAVYADGEREALPVPGAATAGAPAPGR